MFGQVLLMFKCFVAIIALESLLLSVRYFMALQMTRLNKAAVALVTLEWFFSSVFTPHMKCHMACLDA